jgi:hypothetical protein
MILIPLVHGLALVLLLAGLVIVVGIGCLKGRYALSLIGLLVLGGVPALLAAVRVARSDSWWARRFYDDPKFRLAAHRYPGRSGVNDALTL